MNMTVCAKKIVSPDSEFSMEYKVINTPWVFLKLRKEDYYKCVNYKVSNVAGYGITMEQAYKDWKKCAETHIEYLSNIVYNLENMDSFELINGKEVGDNNG